MTPSLYVPLPRTFPNLHHNLNRNLPALLQAGLSSRIEASLRFRQRFRSLRFPHPRPSHLCHDEVRIPNPSLQCLLSHNTHPKVVSVLRVLLSVLRGTESGRKRFRVATGSRSSASALTISRTYTRTTSCPLLACSIWNSCKFSKERKWVTDPAQTPLPSLSLVHVVANAMMYLPLVLVVVLVLESPSFDFRGRRAKDEDDYENTSPYLRS
jgi:hypothetical protein